jgi:hypothetical protein
MPRSIKSRVVYGRNWVIPITGPLGEGFGWAVSINGAGNIIAVGEFGGAGKVHIYELINNSWTPLGSAVEGGVHNGFFDNFGFSIDLNESGNRFVASSIYGNLGNGEEAGFVQVYDWINGQWTQVGSTLQGNAAFSNFGWKVEMTADGSRFIANADGGDEAIYVFEEVNGDWQTIGQVFLNSQYGNSILYNCCIDKIGNTIAFSQYNSPEVTRVFSLENELWVQKGSPITFRGYCSLNGNGSMIAVSDPSILTSTGGIAKIYQFQSDDWIQLGQDIIANQDDFLGVCNDLNYVGNRFLVGLSGAGTGLTGATQVYENSSIPYAPIPYLTELPEIIAACSVESIEAPLAYNNNDDQIEGVTLTMFPILETTTIVWTYNDGNGFVSNQEQDVIVEDTAAPVPDIETLESVIAECEVAELTHPTATDNCAAEVLVSHNATLPIIGQGITIITWSYDDGNGNISVQEQMVIIEDTTAPMPELASLPSINAVCEVNELISPSATDNCAITVSVSNNAVLPITAIGSTTVIWTYNDGHGNSTTQNQEVIIEAIDASVTVQDNVLTANADNLIYQWVDCNNGNEPIDGATSQSFTPTISGNYAVIVSQNDCEEISDCVDVTIISVDEITANEIVIFPNPSSGIFQIQTLERIMNIRVYDALGREIDVEYLAGSNEVNCGKVASGSYFVELILENFTMYKSLSIQ